MKAAIGCLSMTIAFLIFRQWLNADIEHEFRVKKLVNWPRGKIETSYYRIQIPKDYFLLRNTDSLQIIVRYPISDHRPNWANFPGGAPLKYRTDGFILSRQYNIDKVDSLDRLIEMEVRIGTLDWMGEIDTIEIGGHRFIGRTGSIVSNEGMKTKSRGKFGIYYDFKQKVWIEVWGENLESMINDFQVEFK